MFGNHACINSSTIFMLVTSTAYKLLQNLQLKVIIFILNSPGLQKFQNLRMKDITCLTFLYKTCSEY
jgi:hypothetical protein